MTQLSKIPLSNFVKNYIIESFRWLISALSKQDEVDTFLNDFLTKTEKLMLAKRFYIALMLEKGFSYTEIINVLKVSPSTIYKIQQIVSSGKGYKVAIAKITKKERLDEFWKRVNKLLSLLTKGARIYNQAD